MIMMATIKGLLVPFEILIKSFINIFFLKGNLKNFKKLKNLKKKKIFFYHLKFYWLLNEFLI